MTTDLHALVAAYALDALDTDERSEFETHLATCDDCVRELAEFADVAGGLAEATSTAPPPHVRDNVLHALTDVTQDRPAEPEASPVVSLEAHRRRRFSVANMLSAAAVVALIAIGAIVITGTRGGSDYDDVAGASDAVVTVLEGETGSVQVAYSAERDEVALRAENVADLDPEERYALWAIADGTPIPAGLFEVDGGKISDVADAPDVVAQAWGITVESADGADVPTLPIIYFAEA